MGFAGRPAGYYRGMTISIVLWLVAGIVAGVGAFLRTHPLQVTLVAAALCFGFFGFVASGLGA